MKPMDGADLHLPPFTEQAMLTDGGVYDNLGLERVWRRCRTIFVSNGGATMPAVGAPKRFWPLQTLRAFGDFPAAAENSRKRLLFGVHNHKQRNVAFWSI